MADPLVLAIDQGTSSTRAVVFDAAWRTVATASRPLRTRHPRPGWAEQDPEEILEGVVSTVGEVLGGIGGTRHIAAVGIANQGETVVGWDARTGEALAPAILWQCRRSRPIVERIAAAGLGPAIAGRTGLPLDPYFSASKLCWLLEEAPAVRAAVRTGTLRFGTVDAWLTARLGALARTDTSTASRTQLFGLASLTWDPELLDWWGVPTETLPVVGPSAGDLGRIGHPTWGGDLPLTAMLCDQQAALYGEGCLQPGSVKATYGTGVFVLANAGGVAPDRPAGILATVGWTDVDGSTTYALDGGVFSAGSLLEWLRSDLRVIESAEEAGTLAATVADTAGVWFLPALGGVGAPWWDPDARAVIAGLSAASTRAHVARAALDGIAHRVCDIVEAMARGVAEPTQPLRVDGGLTANTHLMARQADLLGQPVEVAAVAESTALGVAFMAARGAGLSRDPLGVSSATARRIEPRLATTARERERDGWREFRIHASTLGGVTSDTSQERE